MSQKIFYVQVIEAREVISRFPGSVVSPGVVVKYNGTKKSTGYKAGKTYWAEIFTFPVDNVLTDNISFQLREKGYHVVSSDWIGEIKLKMSDYDDGNVHLKWFRLGATDGKQHSRAPKGVILLKIHLTTRSDKPFYKKPAERQLSYDEWIEWSESQYANKHTSGAAAQPYPVEGSLARSRSVSISGDSRRDHYAKHRSKSVSDPATGLNGLDNRKLARSAETPSDGDVSDRSSSSGSPPARLMREDSANSTGEEMPQKKFPISPLTSSPPQPVMKRLPNDLLIDLSTPEMRTPKQAVPRKTSTNPFSADVMSLADKFAESTTMSTHQPMGARQLTGNPFLDPTPEISRVSRPHEAY